MRPRVFPAEDDIPIFNMATMDVEASMRPRVFPAEDAVAALHDEPSCRLLQ